MNSVDFKFSRYAAGGMSEVSNNKIEWWEKTILKPDVSDITYTVENFYTGRIDLIANAFLGEPRYWWVIAQLNNILDPISEITPGRKLLIPTRERLDLMLNKKLGGTESKRIPISEISPLVI